MPFEHLVVVMMENHSFDNLLGALSLTRPDVDGLTFENGEAKDWNPGGSRTASRVGAFPLTGTAQGSIIDMRSVPLSGFHDFGENGRRIEEFLLALDEKITLTLRDAPQTPATLDVETPPPPPTEGETD